MLSGWQRELQIYVICPTFQLGDSAAVQNWKRSAHAAAFARWSALSGQYRGTQGGWELVQNKLSPKPLSTLKSTAMRPWGALPLQPYTGIILAFRKHYKFHFSLTSWCDKKDLHYISPDNYSERLKWSQSAIFCVDKSRLKRYLLYRK